MMMDSSSVAVELDSKIVYPWIRKFGYYDVIWKIEDYSLSSNDQNSRLESPVLYISGSQLTKWKLMIHHAKENKKSYALFSIKRLRSDQGSKVVWVQWKSWIKWMENDSEKQLFLLEHEQRFVKNQIFQSDKIPMKCLRKNRDSMDKDVFEVRCLMVFAQEYENNPFNELFVHSDLRSLSNALSKLLSSKKFYNLKILTQWGTVLAHKEILYYRNKVLAEMIACAEERNCEFIDLSDMKFEDMLSVVRYLYSGNISEVLHRPSMSKKVLLEKLKVSEVSECYILDHLYIESKYGIETSETVFEIEKYSRQNQLKCLSQVVNHGPDFQWILNFYPNGLLPDEFLNFNYTAITFEVVRGEHPFMVKIEVSLMDNGLNKFNTEKKCMKYNGQCLGIPFFAKRDVIMASLINDTLIIHAKLVAAKNSIWMNKLIYNNDLNQRWGVNTYKKLSFDMKTMLQDRKYCNITLQGSNFSCQAHLSLLSARFQNISVFYRKGDLITFNAKEHVFNCVLHYIYTGDLKDYEFSHLYEIYLLADLFQIDSLQLACSKLLKDNIDLQTVFDIFKCSNERNDKCLKHMALKFISKNFQKLLEDSKWRDLMQSESPLRNDIQTFLEVNGFGKKSCL